MDEPDIPSEIPQDASAWADALNKAFAKRAPHLQELAEQAIREHPREPQILYLAAVAALLEENPERCLRYLTRIGRDYVLDNREHLLRAIALAQQGILAGALNLLKKSGLNSSRQAAFWFSADWSLWPWVAEWLWVLSDLGTLAGPPRAAPCRREWQARRPHTRTERGPRRFPPEDEIRC